MRVRTRDCKRPTHDNSKNEINDSADAAIDCRAEKQARGRQPRLSDTNAQRGVPVREPATSKTASTVKHVFADEEPNAEEGRSLALDPVQVPPNSLCIVSGSFRFSTQPSSFVRTSSISPLCAHTTARAPVASGA